MMKNVFADLGTRYGICCKPFSGMKIEDYKRERESKNYIKAYYIAIAMLTDYLVEIKKHTNRILRIIRQLGNSYFIKI